MGKKKFLERISDALGLYDPDDPNREMDEEEDDEEEEEVVEKPAKRSPPGSCSGSKRRTGICSCG